MIKPSFSTFSQMALKGNLIPVYQELLGDLETPVSAYLKIKEKSFSYLLESADGVRNWGRYSFIGYQPYLTAGYQDRKIEIQTGSDQKIVPNVDDPLPVLREISRQFKPVAMKDLPPFQSGLVGYINYDLIRNWESLPGVSPADSEMPEALFTVSRRLIIFDHLTHRIMVVAFAHLTGDNDIKEAYLRACREVEDTITELKQPLPSVIPGNGLVLDGLQSNFTKTDFEKAVDKAKDYIVAGDAIQVVLSQKFTGRVKGDTFNLYRNLRSVNPSPYMFYLNYGHVKFIGASPEILVRLTDGKIELRPIAGTRPRGENPEMDRALEKELLEDEKERAEHVMLVDLGRNDVGKAAVTASVSVPRFMEVERYSHVMHIVSRVEGRLKPELDALDLFRSAFPAGTVSGAPKVRAMEIINELEPCPRGPYAGAVGYFGFTGNMDFCITIRTITVFRNTLSFQVGAGIVADSVPEREYQETLNKAGAMRQAIQRVQSNDSHDR